MARPTVLIIAAPGNESLRWQVEAEMDRRGWQPALSAAEASLLLSIGTFPAPLSEAADVLWSQMPQPRYRQAIGDTGVSRQLDAAAAALSAPSAYEHNELDAAAQLSQESDAGHDMHGDMQSPEAGMGGHDGHEMSHGGREAGDHSGHEMGGPEGHGMDGHDGHEMSHGGHEAGDHASHEMDGHEGHDMGGHEHMHHGGEVAGLAMAGMAPDRDGLQLDELKVSLGPVLAGWPTGLVLKASMQGDVLSDVSLSWIDGIEGHHAAPHSQYRTILLAVDALAQFALLAGWPHIARKTRQARAMLCSNNPDQRKRGQVRARAVARKISSSRLLAWSIGGLGVDRSSSQELKTPEVGRGTGDVLDRVRGLCAVVIGEDPSSVDGMPSARPEDVEFLLEGAELAAARLIVASFVFESSPAELHSGAEHD